MQVYSLCVQNALKSEPAQPAPSSWTMGQSGLEGWLGHGASGLTPHDSAGLGLNAHDLTGAVVTSGDVNPVKNTSNSYGEINMLTQRETKSKAFTTKWPNYLSSEV